jgi:hypothetical protein
LYRQIFMVRAHRLIRRIIVSARASTAWRDGQAEGTGPARCADPSLDDFVRPSEHRRWDREAEGLILLILLPTFS